MLLTCGTSRPPVVATIINEYSPALTKWIFQLSGNVLFQVSRGSLRRYCFDSSIGNGLVDQFFRLLLDSF
jgi:hypothetical protein